MFPPIICITCSRRGQEEGCHGGSPEGLDFEVRKSGKEPPITFELNETLCTRAKSGGTDATYPWLEHHLSFISMTWSTTWPTESHSVTHCQVHAPTCFSLNELSPINIDSPTEVPGHDSRHPSFFNSEASSPLSELEAGFKPSQTNVVSSYETPMSSSCLEQN